MITIIVPYEVFNECSEETLIYPFEHFMFYGLIQIKIDLSENEPNVLFECSIDQASLSGREKVSFDGGKNWIRSMKFDFIWGLDRVSNGDMYAEDRPTRLNGYTCLNIIGYIMQKGLERQREYKKSGGRKYKYSREHRLSTQFNKIYLFKDIVNYVSEHYIPSKEHHEIQCPCWEVRGHYRHYKSGKTVFIQSYKKGKQKDKVEPKSKTYLATKGSI